MLITNTDGLRRFCGEVADQPYVAVDTEFIGEKTYRPRLCLVQLGTNGRSVAIDPLARGIDLAPLYDLMRNPRLLKVFHSARQDLGIFYDHMGRLPGPIFDTQVAAMVCGYGESVAYATLVRKLAGVAVDKSSRYTDWSRRPLSKKQLRYALADVSYLCAVYEGLQRELLHSGRMPWLAEEMDVLTSPATYRQTPREAWRRVRGRRGGPRTLAVLREVAEWREVEAERRDVPRPRVLRDDVLVEIAAHAPRTSEELERIRGVSQGFSRGRMGRQLLHAVERGVSLPPSEWPAAPARPASANGVASMVALLEALLKVKCETHGVARKLVATKAHLEMIAADDAADVPALRGWRRTLFGADALALKHGELALTVAGDAVRFVDVNHHR